MKKGVLHCVNITNQLSIKTDLEKWTNIQEESG